MGSYRKQCRQRADLYMSRTHARITTRLRASAAALKTAGVPESLRSVSTSLEMGPISWVGPGESTLAHTSVAMYPFERFTERAKKTLTLAQEEAERSHHSYIGTEHLLLGLLRNKEGLGYRVLGALGVRIEVVRETIESVLGRNERIIVRQIIPTSRVKKVIELSFEEAQRMGHEYVGTEHLLLGLMIEGEGVAAHVLSDLGVTLAKVRDEIERQLMGGVAPEAVSGPRAADHQHTGVGSYLENLEALLAETSVAQLLRVRGLDVDELTVQLKAAPELVLNLRRHLSNLTNELEGAVKNADYERCARIQKARDEMAARLRKAEHDWVNDLTRPPSST